MLLMNSSYDTFESDICCLSTLHSYHTVERELDSLDRSYYDLSIT